MLKEFLLRFKLPDEDLLHSLAKIIYLNIFTINRFFIFEYDLQNQKPEQHHVDTEEEFDFKVLPGASIANFLPEGINLPREFHIHEIDKVNHCVVALKDNVIAHIFWLYEKDNPSRCFRLKEGEVCINYAYTLPEHRGKRLYPKGILFAVRYLKEKGYKKVLTVAHEGTKNTLASYRKIEGLEKIAELRQWFIIRPKYSSPKFL